MRSDLSRRGLFKGMAAAALASALPAEAMAAQPQKKPWWLGDGMPQEGSGTPKIACPIALRDGVSDEAIRSVVEIGVYHVLSGGPKIPWEASQLQPIADKLKAAGVTLGNLMIGGFPNVLYGRPGRDEEIEKVGQSIQAAGQAGIPVVEYNFYAHRAMEAYYEEDGRGGAGLTGVDYERMKGLDRCLGKAFTPEPDVGEHHLFLEGRDSGCREGQRAAGAASQRPAISLEPRLAADHGHPRGMEAPDRNRE